LAALMEARTTAKPTACNEDSSAGRALSSVRLLLESCFLPHSRSCRDPNCGLVASRVGKTLRRVGVRKGVKEVRCQLPRARYPGGLPAVAAHVPRHHGGWSLLASFSSAFQRPSATLTQFLQQQVGAVILPGPMRDLLGACLTFLTLSVSYVVMLGRCLQLVSDE
jgi:hypothetical protein